MTILGVRRHADQSGNCPHRQRCGHRLVRSVRQRHIGQCHIRSISERGSVDEYNIAFGGNINNVVYWGMNFDIVAMDYRISSMWNENLQDAWVFNPNTRKVSQMDARWALRDNYRLSGTGFNYQLGVIVKPIQELRLGLAFHTPTFYKLTETFNPERIEYSYPFGSDFCRDQ